MFMNDDELQDVRNENVECVNVAGEGGCGNGIFGKGGEAEGIK